MTLGLLDQSFIAFAHETIPALQNVIKIGSEILDIGGFNFHYNVKKVFMLYMFWLVKRNKSTKQVLNK